MARKPGQGRASLGTSPWEAWAGNAAAGWEGSPSLSLQQWLGVGTAKSLTCSPCSSPSFLGLCVGKKLCVCGACWWGVVWGLAHSVGVDFGGNSILCPETADEDLQ